MIVLAGLRGDRSVQEVCREYQLSDTLYDGWRDKLFEGGRAALAGKEDRDGERELKDPGKVGGSDAGRCPGGRRCSCDGQSEEVLR